MTIIASTIAFAILTVAGAKLFKAHLDRHYPSVDDEGEIEAFLAAHLERDLSKPGSLSPLLIDG